MNSYKNHRAEPYFSFLKNGQKTIEGRVRKGWYAKVEAGDQILVQNNDESDSVLARAIRVTPYKNFKTMLESEVLAKVLPDATSVDDGVRIYNQFYTDEQQTEFGVVAIEVELLD